MDKWRLSRRRRKRILAVFFTFIILPLVIYHGYFVSIFLTHHQYDGERGLVRLFIYAPHIFLVAGVIDISAYLLSLSPPENFVNRQPDAFMFVLFSDAILIACLWFTIKVTEIVFRRITSFRRPNVILVVGILGTLMATETRAWEVNIHENIATESFLGQFQSAGGKAIISETVFAVENDVAGHFRLGTIRDLILDGVRNEDSVTLFPTVSPRPIRHFYNPINNSGLTVALPDANPSLLWALAANTPGPFQNHFNLPSAREEYVGALTTTVPSARNSHFGAFYYRVGMLMHLVQDLTQAEHVRDDPHPTQYLEKYAAAQ
ncbi:hypothetical protein D6779_03275, partial [Candidatus Parcubacteria bacterium]